MVSSVVSSQVDLHARYGGVVPELASRAHIEQIMPVVTLALEAAGLDPTGRPLSCHSAAGGPPAAGGRPEAARRGSPAEPLAARRIDAVAATVGPGLVGALLVGISFAKAMAMAWDLPFVAVNHLEGHLYAALLEDPGLQLPVVVLLVSGGHTMLIRMDAPGDYEVLGRTRDDAAGEAFDKVARYLGLGYPGGPAIDRIAGGGDARAVKLPRAWLDGSADFSFSGLKTSVVNQVTAEPALATADVAASFQEAVVDVLVQKTMAAAEKVGARGICLAGGVGANSLLRQRLRTAGAAAGLPVFLPSRAMCTDNAAMIAAAAYGRLRRDGPSRLGAGAVPGMGLGSP